MPKKIDRVFAAAIIFLNGWNGALPVTLKPLPVWFTPVQVVHGIYTHELLLIIYLGILIERRRNLPIHNLGTGNKIARIIIGLGILGIFSNGVNLAPLKEMGEAGRLFVLAIFFLMSIYWAKRHSPRFVLLSFCIGIASAGIVNLYYSYAISDVVLEGLPFLLGQKGPGGSMGLMVLFTAWLMMEQKSVYNSAILLMLAGIGVFGASISYSKLAMTMAGCGLVAWCFVLFGNFTKRHARWPTIAMLVVFFALTGHFSVSVNQYIKGVNAYIDRKFVHLSELSVKARMLYFPATMEIMSAHPLFGVGSAGFYDAVIKTETYKNRDVARENPIAGKEGKSNPHNAFLYYASANGLPGLLLSIVLFLSIFRAFWQHFSGRGFTGRVVWVCFAGAYFTYGTSVPSLFNTATLYIPAAVAIAFTWQYRSTLQQIKQTKEPKPTYIVQQ